MCDTSGYMWKSKDEKDIKLTSKLMYFDLDQIDCLEEMAANFITAYKDKISVLTKSVGGKGLSIYLTVDEISKENYRYVYEALLQLFGVSASTQNVRTQQEHMLFTLTIMFILIPPQVSMPVLSVIKYQEVRQVKKVQLNV